MVFGQLPRAPRQPVHELMIYAGIYCKVYAIADENTLLPQHAHEHDHLTLLIRGVVRVFVSERDSVGANYIAPAMIKVPAHTMHRFLTLTDDVMLACIHSVGEAEAPAIATEHHLDVED